MKLMAKIFIAMTVGLLLSSDDAEACTRVVYVGDNNEIVTIQSIFKIGTVLSVNGREVKIKVDKQKNLSSHNITFFSGVHNTLS